MKIWKRTVAAAFAALTVAGAVPALATDPAEETAEATVEVVETAETTETATLVDAENVETMETAEPTDNSTPTTPDTPTDTDDANEQLDQNADMTPTFEVTGKGGGLNADYVLWMSNYSPAQVKSITFWVEMPENVRVCDVEAHQNHSTTEMDDSSFRVTVDVPEKMGIVEPVKVLLYATVADTYEIVFHGTLNYRDGSNRDLTASATMTATPVVEMWEFYTTDAIAFVHGMTESELSGLTAFLATYSPEGQMLAMRTASVNYSEAITGPCGRVSFELTEPCEMQEGNTQRLFFLDSACRPVLPTVQVPNGTMNGVHLGPSAFGPVAA